jgi:hypothetical protein
MIDQSNASAQHSPIPADDLTRQLTWCAPNTDESLPHLALVGDTYTILVSGEETAGRYTSSTCLSRPVADRLLIAMISRRCSPYSKAKSN